MKFIVNRVIDSSILLLVLALIIALSGSAVRAQRFYDDFDVPYNNLSEEDDDWEAIWIDGWTTGMNTSGASPSTDENGPGSFGVPADAFDNALVTGQNDWHDYEIDASYYVNDNDGLGVVLRYTSVSAYYLVVMSRNEMPTITGRSETLSKIETRIYRVSDADGTALLGQVSGKAYLPNSSERQFIRVQIAANEISVWLGSDTSPITESTLPILNLTDSNTAISAGKAGMYAFAMGEAKSGTFFDDFRVTALDSDQDGRKNDEEIFYGTNPYDADSDDDGISDSNEYLWNEDTDNDGLVNAADPDADNDGLYDGLEIGVTVPAADTDLTAGFYTADLQPQTTTDRLNPDSDGDGLLDGEEDANHNGMVDTLAGETNPNNYDGPLDTDTSGVETDRIDPATDPIDTTDNSSDTATNDIDNTATASPASDNDPTYQLGGGYACSTASMPASPSLIKLLFGMFFYVNY